MSGSETVCFRPPAAKPATLVIVDCERHLHMVNISGSLSLGRDGNCDIVLDDEMASRRHAELKKHEGQWYLQDLKSKNGVRLNAKEISADEIGLRDLDVLRISDTTLIFFNDKILYNSGNSDKVSLSVRIRKKTVDSGRKTLLKNIDAEFESGDFVLILGGSGCGKQR